jgi:hypothetical protein
MVEMEIKAAGENVATLEKKFLEMQSQRERFKNALKDKGSTTQPFFDLCNSMFANFKSFPLHCFNSQTAIAPSFALSPPQISFRFSASTFDDHATSVPLRLPPISATIEAIDVSVLAFDDSEPLIVHSQVSPKICVSTPNALFCFLLALIFFCSQAAAAFKDFKPFHLLLKHFEASRAPLLLRHK